VGIGINGYISVTIKGNEGLDVIVRDTNVNPVIYASVDGSPVVPRRTVVKRESCNQCHLDLGSPAGFSVHGGTRRSPEFCSLCHNANLTDEGRRAARRPPGEMPPESMQFKYLVHSIHAGDERAIPSWFGSATRTEETFYPGDAQNCSTCHVGESYALPLPTGVLPQTITQAGQVVKTVPPIQAACNACHIGNPGFNAHVDTMTSAKYGEACSNCHSRGKDFDVIKVHSP
jgi:OmcA/MtrC family decaheme c-type cytochrome